MRTKNRWRLQKMCFPIVLLGMFLIGWGCAQSEGETHAQVKPLNIGDRPIRVVTTTGMIADAVKNVGGERVEVTALMGPGVDPHLYKASEGDVARLSKADVIFYNGLHLEGKMVEIFEQMRRKKPTFAVADGVDKARLIQSEQFVGSYDPHIWFDVSIWRQVVLYIRDVLSQLDPGHAPLYQQNARRYLQQLDELDAYVRQRIAEIPENKRVLITAHDAFEYFGRAYGMEVYGLQGISTASEAGTADVQRLADFIVQRQIPAIFVETSVPPRYIEALKEAVRARGFEVKIGGSLFSDAMGDPGTEEGTYLGMVKHNVDTIVNALTGKTGSEHALRGPESMQNRTVF